MALAKTTKDHDEIRKWAEARGGKPAAVAATEGENETGIIRLMFPNAPHHNDDALEEIGWDEWFEKFDASGLELTYQEKTADGQQSDFNRLTYPEVDSKAGKALLKKSAGKKSAAKKFAGIKSAGKPATKKVAAKAPAKKTVAKVAAKKAASKKTPAKKIASKKTASKSASKKTSPSTPARNYPKPNSSGPNQIF